MLVAPNGQRMARPASERAHWQGLGAQILDNFAVQSQTPNRGSSLAALSSGERAR